MINKGKDKKNIFYYITLTTKKDLKRQQKLRVEGKYMGMV